MSYDFGSHDFSRCRTVSRSPLASHRCMLGTSFACRVTLCAVAGFFWATLCGPWHPANISTNATPASARGTTSGLDLRQHDRRHAEMGHAGITTDGLLGHLERVLERGRALETKPVDHVAIGADKDDVASVLHRVRSPYPRIVRVDAVIGV